MLHQDVICGPSPLHWALVMRAITQGLTFILFWLVFKEDAGPDEPEKNFLSSTAG